MLIQCPHCGKNLSDKVKQCIHCGAMIAENEQTNPKNATIDYFSLSEEKQNALHEEFLAEFPEHKKTLRTHKTSIIISLCLYGLCLLLAVALIIVVNSSNMNNPSTGAIISLVAIFLFVIIGLITALVFTGKAKSASKKFLVISKTKDIWLQKKNIVGLNRLIDTEEREKYDSIQIDL
ncbi:MAG: zinc ribbon domain-containing protein [Clostridiales bacterium]|nr:zinc ribbon domain-containing protein [Clostridiales bacterium]